MPDGGDEMPYRIVVRSDFGFELIETVGEFLVIEHELPQLDEGSHDKHADLDRARRIEDCRRHDRAVLGKDVRAVTEVAFGCGHKL